MGVHLRGDVKRQFVFTNDCELRQFDIRAQFRANIRVGVQYLAAWLGGKGAVPLYNLMEDAATAEICRAQLWQWLKFEAPLDDGRRFTLDLFEQWFDEEVGLLAELPNIAEAARLMHNMIVADELVEFLTLPAYELLD